jgi:hypothetical protein
VAASWTIAPILSEFPKDFLFHCVHATPQGEQMRRLVHSASLFAAKHGYEVMTNLRTLLINARAFIRVISPILARIIEGLTAAI